MINDLMRRGWERVSTNEFIKESWTFRTCDNTIEVYSNPDNGNGKYFVTSIDKVQDINYLLDEVDEFLMRE